MPIIAKDNAKEFPTAPEGLYQAVCVDVIDLGMVETQWGAKPKVRLRWQIDEMEPGTERPFQIQGTYTLTLNEKGRLRPHLEAWRGRAFTQKELQGFDLETVVGVNCQLMLVHTVTDGGKVYCNVQAIVPINKGMAKMQPKDYVREEDRPKQGGRAGTTGSEEYEPDEDIPF